MLSRITTKVKSFTIMGKSIIAILAVKIFVQTDMHTFSKWVILNSFT